jgi:hypothetical protein
MSEFRLPDKRATIELSDVGLPGGEIDVSVRMPLALMEAAASFIGEGKLADVRALFLKWADARWNLTDHGGAVPVSEEGFGRLEAAEQLAICAAWLRGVVQPAAPLPPRSSSTARSGAKSRRRSTGRKSTTTSSASTPATP